MQPEETESQNSEIDMNDSADELENDMADPGNASAEDHDSVLADAMDPIDETPKSDSERVREAEKEALLAKAEMENFRKRMQRESDQQLKYANLALIRDLLEVVDNLHRAQEAAENDEQSQGLLAGVAMVSQQLSDVLAKFGCKPIPALGQEFDPNVHEAISQMSSDEYANGIVMNEVAVGYMLHDRVVRPSNVVVSKGNAESE